ncbi:hypothetical protein U1Q18_000329 [Sarracenia purpurea var. burkii]
MVRGVGENEESEASSGSNNSKEEDGDEGGSKDEEWASSCGCDKSVGIAMNGPSSCIDDEVKISDSRITGPVLVQNTGDCDLENKGIHTKDNGGKPFPAH